MLFSTLDSLGEKTINKIAEMAFKTQIKDAKYLSVQVKTDPQLLAKGVLESLHIDGNGLIMQENLPLEKMKITLNNIAVNPLKALMGNVQLTQPSKGKALVVLTEKDIETALNINNLNQQLKGEKNSAHIKFVKVDFRILGDGRIAIKGKVKSHDNYSVEKVCLIIKPRVCELKQEILIDEITCTQGDNNCSIIIKVLLKEVIKIFSLNNLLIEGISLKVNHLKVEEGKLNLLANAGITHLPTR